MTHSEIERPNSIRKGNQGMVLGILTYKVPTFKLKNQKHVSMA